MFTNSILTVHRFALYVLMKVPTYSWSASYPIRSYLSSCLTPWNLSEFLQISPLSLTLIPNPSFWRASTYRGKYFPLDSRWTRPSASHEQAPWPDSVSAVYRPDPGPCYVTWNGPRPSSLPVPRQRRQCSFGCGVTDHRSIATVVVVAGGPRSFFKAIAYYGFSYIMRIPRIFLLYFWY